MVALPRTQTIRPLIRGLATHAALPVKDCSSITPPYSRLIKTLENVRQVLPSNSKLTLAEKILYSHLRNPEESLDGGGKVRGERYLKLRPDRVAMQDASAQMALLQFMTCRLPSCAVPASIHCDHLIQAQMGAATDLSRSIDNNKEVFDFLQSAAAKYGIEFWKPGSGIIHQIVLENYAAPGLLMLGTDSHTPNAGGLGMLAIGVGGADAVDALTDTPWELKAPLVTGVKLTGQLQGWATPKDLILHLVGKLTVRGGTGRILEYFGPGVATQSCTGLATIANMGAEVGATTSTFPYSSNMRQYLQATGRGPVADAADQAASQGFLQADEGAEYDEVIEINLSELEPHLNGPFTPDLATPLSQFSKFIKEKKYPTSLSSALIGSCTNSSYEDMSRVASIAEQAKAAGLRSKVPFLVTPGSELIRATIERDGLQGTLETVGATVLANACGPCIGQWRRDEKKGEENAILTSFNRNFKARNDGNMKTMNFLASPEIVTAMAFSGDLNFNPVTDSIPTPNGPFKFEPPSGDRLPPSGYTPGDLTYTPSVSPKPEPQTEIVISPSSIRLEILEPFGTNFPLGGGELTELTCLMRVRGKCTTDHISAAGAWLKYKGHLSNISENTLMTAVNDEGGQINVARDISGQEDTIPRIMQQYKARSEPWMLVVDENYGEGSAREHAALQPRFYGCALIIARSFARIHETNLKKQGILPLWFVDKDDYNKISAHDKIGTKGLTEVMAIKGGNIITVVIEKPTGEKVNITTRHTLSKDQVEWLRAGSALNWIGEQARKAGKT
ncbi:aconitate hydratase, mitochondrial [Cryptococcus depauperatus]|nr:aconitate hydratase, mitochondrial [Cryptococcus depauperatus CBS 7855]